MSDTEAILAERASHTLRKLDEIRSGIKTELNSEELDRVFGDHTCVYATGSAGRLELSIHSDLDAFVLRNTAEASNLDTMLIQAAVLRTSRKCDFPDPSRDGHFLRMHTLDEMLRRMGTPEDDTANTFTARMLLLLESKPLYGDGAYKVALDRIVETYWRYEDEHPNDYLPLVLLNDVIRYWRIVLLNYEAENTKTAANNAGAQDPNRRLRSYKLRFSRCLICYSAVCFLLNEARRDKGNVTRDSVAQMVSITPLDRLRSIESTERPEEQAILRRLRDLYAVFLHHTNDPKAKLLDRFRDTEFRRARSREAGEFGDKLFRLLELLGRENRLYRFVLV